MSTANRRFGRRVLPPPEEPFFVDLDLPERAISCRLVDLSKVAVRIAPPEGMVVDWQEGMWVEQVRIRYGDVPVETLGTLEVTELSVDKRGLTVLLTARESVEKAAVWRALNSLATGEIGRFGSTTIAPGHIPRVPARGLYTEEARMERLDFMRELSEAPMLHTAHTRLRADKLTGNIENFLGSVEIPVGLAGPLLFRGQDAKGPLYAPLATTEGALVASATRGSRAITESGGVTTRVVSQRMMRVPLFVLGDMRGALVFTNWIRDHEAEIREQCMRVSRHANLVRVQPKALGNMVHVEFLYETGDAAGQNMTTTCTWHACQWVMKQMEHMDAIRFDNFIIEANMSGDKKVNFGSFIEGRGTRVTAEALLDRDSVETILKVSPEQLLRSNQGFLAGSVQRGMVGYNINVANIVAALFTATGQDIACVHESSLGQFHLAPAPEGIYASLLLPSLIVGTVGGGTGLPNQNEYLQMMDCAGPGKVARLAEIVAGFCLALDLSTLSAIASGQFARAHERLGRNRPVKWFKKQEITPAFFEGAMRAQSGDEDLNVHTAEPVTNVKLGSSIITELTARKVKKLVGHFPYRLQWSDGKGVEQGPTEVLVKAKPVDGEVVVMVNSMAAMCGPRLAAAHNKFKEKLGFRGCDRRELAIYRQRDPRFVDHSPRAWGIIEDKEREAYILVLERLQNLVHMDSADDVSGWEPDHIETALEGIAQVHAIWYDREDELREQDWIVDPPSYATMVDLTELWEALGVHAMEEFPHWFGKNDLKLHRTLVSNIPRWWKPIEDLPKTLIHNDFNPRNLALRPGDGGKLRLCAYDWELATVHIPQRDVAEFLAFVLPPDVTEDRVSHYVGVHRKALEKAAGVSIPEDQSHFAYRRGLQDFAITRFGLYCMAHTFRHYGFMERVARTVRHLIRLEMGK